MQTTTLNLDSVATIPLYPLYLTETKLTGDLPEQAANSLPDISPLGLSVHLPVNYTNDYLEGLLTELSRYADLAGNHRKIQQIWFQGKGLITLPPAGLTQLAYRVGSHFQLADHDNSEYGIEICHSQVTPEHLALLRGLGFKQLRIHFGACRCLSHGDWISEVANSIELLGSYDFEEIYCRVHLGDFAQQSDIKKLLLSLHLYQPQQIELIGISDNSTPSRIPSRESRTLYMGLMEFLTQRDYQILGNHLFISSSSRLCQLYQQRNLAFTPQGFCSAQNTDWLGTGLGAVSHINNQYHQNSCDLEQYLQLLQTGALPRDKMLPSQQPGIRAIVQNLLCYGALNNKLIQQLPAEQSATVKTVIETATDKFWLDPTDNLWRLTLCGRIYLRQLLEKLLHTQTSTSSAISTQNMSL